MFLKILVSKLYYRYRYCYRYHYRWCSVQFVLSAPTRVAKQANSRVTVSAAFAAGEWRCLLRGCRCVFFLLAHFSLRSSFLSSLALCTPFRTARHQAAQSTAHCSHASQFQIFLADIFEAQAWSAPRPKPSVSSPYSRSLGMRPGSIFLMWSSQRRLLSQIKGDKIRPPSSLCFTRRLYCPLCSLCTFFRVDAPLRTSP